jgi:hypothetical protein
MEPVENHPEWDAVYTRQIREFATGPEFLTDLVDHLPKSDHIPTPLAFNSYIAGAPDHLTYAADVHRYMRALAAASPRVKVFSIGTSEEGREMIVVAISDEATIAALDEYRGITARLADPRRISEAEAQKLIARGKPIYYATGAMHSPETGSPEMLMELAYRLAVEETPLIRSIRKDVITLITPVLEVDGRERMVDTVRWRDGNHRSESLPLIYWGHYVAHDDNRDTINMALALTKNVLHTYFDWHPQVLHDLHESIPFLYISTGTGPYNAWLDPLMIDEWQRMAYHEVQVLTQKGLPGVWTQGFYDGWAPNYLFWVAMGHNSVGRFYETFGNLVPSTENRVIRDESQRAPYRPNPPLPAVRWSLRNNVNYQQSGLLLALGDVAERHTHFLQQFWDLAKRSVAKARTEGPAAYVLDGSQKRQGQLRELLELMRKHGIEVQVADKPFSLKPGWPPPKAVDNASKAATSSIEESRTTPSETANSAKSATTAEPEKKTEETRKFPEGSYIIRMDQPYSRLADALLDTQFVRGEERVYDDTGWTVGYARNLEVRRIVNQDVLSVPMHLWDEHVRPVSNIGRGAAIAIENTADTDIVRFRYSLPKVRFLVADEEIKGKKNLPAGTIFVPLDASNREEVTAALGRLSLQASDMELLPQVKTHELRVPRLALLHTWIDTQEDGWFRLALEDLKIPYQYISTQDVAGIPDLRSRYDVILFPPAGNSDPEDIVNGLPPGSPLPWKKTDLTPNLGVDETDNMRPGLGLSGVTNLRNFVEAGGLLITVRDTSRWAVAFGLARYVKVLAPENLKARGSLLRAEVVDRSSPISSGYDDSLPVYFQGGPVFKVGVYDPGRPEAGRPSGRGSKNDPDVPQGRPYVALPEKAKSNPWEGGFLPPEELPFFFEPYLPKLKDRPRVILAFPKEADNILLSGMLEGGNSIAGTPIVIDSPLGKGHILLFANNPMWRMTTQGSYALVTNAIMNFGNLGLGSPPAGK